MNSHDERERIKRAMSIGEYPGENDMLDYGPGETKYAVYVDGVKYSATRVKDGFCTLTPGGSVCGESLEGLRDEVIAALRAPKPDNGPLVYILGLGLVRVTP